MRYTEKVLLQHKTASASRISTEASSRSGVFTLFWGGLVGHFEGVTFFVKGYVGLDRGNFTRWLLLCTDRTLFCFRCLLLFETFRTTLHFWLLFFPFRGSLCYWLLFFPFCGSLCYWLLFFSIRGSLCCWLLFFSFCFLSFLARL